MSTPQHLSYLDYPKSSKLQSIQRENLMRILEEEKFTDLKFFVGPNKTIIKANRAFLASISATFEKLLYPTDEKQQPTEIDLPDISPSAFQSVLNFAYCNDPLLTADNVLSLKFLCERFEIISLSQICSEFWMTTLTPNNLCTLLNQSVVINSIEFIQQCQQCLIKFAKNADIMLNSSGFLAMNLKSMIVFLQTDELKIEENDLWEAILKWADHQSDGEQRGETLLMNPLQSQASFSKLTDAEIVQTPRSGAPDIVVPVVDEEEEEKSVVSNNYPPKRDRAISKSKSKSMTAHSKYKKEISYVTPMGGTDEYLDKMDEEDFDNYLSIKIDDDPVFIDLNVAKNTPWKLKIKQPKDRMALLKYIKPYIRWGAMDGKYFVKKVKPEGIFTAEELVTILTYFQCPDEGCGIFETSRRFELKGITIQRGQIELAKWTYPGGKRIDAVAFETNSDAYLHAVGVFNCAGKCTAKVKIFRGENGKHGDNDIIAESDEHIFEAINNPSATPLEVKLSRPVRIEKGEKYTVELLQHNRNQAVSYQIKDGQTMIHEDGLEITFSKAAVSKNGTTVGKGAIPTLYFEM